MPKPMLLCVCLIAMIFVAANEGGGIKARIMCGDKTDYDTNDWYKGARKMQALLLHDRYIDYDASFDSLIKLDDKMYAPHAVKLPFKSCLTEILFQFTALNGQNISARIYLGDAKQWTFTSRVTSVMLEGDVTHLYIRANSATTVLKRISLVGWSKD